MAEIITSGKNNCPHKNLRVDLTPMVDLGFLLITFFILTTTMQQLTAMHLILPKDSNKETEIAESKSLTFILNGNDSISYYAGFANHIDHGMFRSMRNIILQKQQQLTKSHQNKNELTIIIKPAVNSTYKNLVDALDEITISGCKIYFITEPDKSEL